MRAQLAHRLTDLKTEFAAANEMLACTWKPKQTHLRETLLRISGAIQVLEEELARAASPAHNGAAPAAEAKVTRRDRGRLTGHDVPETEGDDPQAVASNPHPLACGTIWLTPSTRPRTRWPSISRSTPCHLPSPPVLPYIALSLGKFTINQHTTDSLTSQPRPQPAAQRVAVDAANPHGPYALAPYAPGRVHTGGGHPGAWHPRQTTGRAGGG